MIFFRLLITFLLITPLTIISFGGCSQKQQDLSPATPEELSQQSEELDKTLWSNEVLAQKYEETFVRLWDNLRTSEDKYDVLKNFKFGDVILGDRQPPTNYEWNIRKTKFSSKPDKAEKITHQQWETFLDNVKSRGFQIRQSEWHHSKFTPPEKGETAQSEVSFEIHLSHVAVEHRVLLKGVLRVKWAELDGSQNMPEPETIDASEVQLWEQVGDPAFKIAGKYAQKPPYPNAPASIVPLAVYDLNGDHYPEILFGGSNAVLWNKGDFKFEIGVLFDEDVWMDNSGVLGDFTGDGLVDYVGIDYKFQACLLAGNEDGKFVSPARRCWQEKIESPSAMTAGDVDGDGDLDIWVTQYKPPYVQGQMPTPYYDANDGFPAYLFLNDGTGNFSDHTESAGLAEKRFRRTYSTSFYDLDDDDDLDLIVVSDFSGLDLYKNDGKGHFTIATSDLVEEHHGFGMSHTFGNFDGDGKLDFYVVGMNSTTAKRLDRLGLHRSDFLDYSEKRPQMTYGNRLYQARDNRFVQTSLNENVAKAGWAWGSAAIDFDNDADDDIYVANGHISGESAKDYCTRYWTHDVYVGSSNEDSAIAEFLTDAYRPLELQGLRNGKISWNGFEHNKLFMNLEGKEFAEIGFLMDVGFEFDSRAVIAADLNLDGKQDLLVIENKWKSTQNGILPNETLIILENQLPTEYHWIGLHLANQAPGPSPIGAKVRIEGEFGSRERRIVTGDSHYSQHPPTVHFGLGSIDQVDLMEIQWQNGRSLRLENPAVDRYHTLDRLSPTTLMENPKDPKKNHEVE